VTVAAPDVREALERMEEDTLVEFYPG